MCLRHYCKSYRNTLKLCLKQLLQEFYPIECVTIPLKTQRVNQVTDVPDRSQVLTVWMWSVVSACVHWHFNILQQFLTFTAQTAQNCRVFPEVQSLLLTKKTPTNQQTKPNQKPPSHQTKKSPHKQYICSTFYLVQHFQARLVSHSIFAKWKALE